MTAPSPPQPQSTIDHPRTHQYKISHPTHIGVANLGLVKGFTWDAVTQENDPKKSFSNFFSVFKVAFNSSFPEIDKMAYNNTVKINPWLTQG